MSGIDLLKFQDPWEACKTDFECGLDKNKDRHTSEISPVKVFTYTYFIIFYKLTL